MHKIAPAGDLGGIKFPRLLSLGIMSAFPISRFKHYLHPSLTDFQYFGCPSAELGRVLNETCPRLRDIVVCFRSAPDDGSAERNLRHLLEFLGHCPLALTTMHLTCAMPDCSVTDALFQHLATRSALEDLHIAQRVSGRGLQASADMERLGGAAPFSRLRRLYVRIRTRDAKQLSRAVPFVSSLRLFLFDDECAALEALEPLIHLSELSVRYDHTTEPLSAGDVAALRHMQGLRSLAIVVDRSLATPLSDTVFSAVVESLSQLRRLKLTVGCRTLGLTSASLVFIGQYCRHLEELEMSGVWDLTCWRDSTLQPLFPMLNSLCLQDAVVQKGDESLEK
jgi:hypothetical protein